MSLLDFINNKILATQIINYDHIITLCNISIINDRMNFPIKSTVLFFMYQLKFNKSYDTIDISNKTYVKYIESVVDINTLHKNYALYRSKYFELCLDTPVYKCINSIINNIYIEESTDIPIIFRYIRYNYTSQQSVDAINNVLHMFYQLNDTNTSCTFKTNAILLYKNIWNKLDVQLHNLIQCIKINNESQTYDIIKFIYKEHLTNLGSGELNYILCDLIPHTSKEIEFIRLRYDITIDPLCFKNIFCSSTILNKYKIYLSEYIKSLYDGIEMQHDSCEIISNGYDYIHTYDEYIRLLEHEANYSDISCHLKNVLEIDIDNASIDEIYTLILIKNVSDLDDLLSRKNINLYTIKYYVTIHHLNQDSHSKKSLSIACQRTNLETVQYLINTLHYIPTLKALYKSIYNTDIFDYMLAFFLNTTNTYLYMLLLTNDLYTDTNWLLEIIKYDINYIYEHTSQSFYELYNENLLYFSMYYNKMHLFNHIIQHNEISGVVILNMACRNTKISKQMFETILNTNISHINDVAIDSALRTDKYDILKKHNITISKTALDYSKRYIILIK